MKASTHFLLPVCAGALLLAIGACHGPNGGPQNTYSGGAGKLDIQKIEGDRYLAAQLKIVNPISKMQDGRQMTQFDLQSSTPDPLKFVYAVDWYDADNFLIDDNQHVFEQINLGGYGVKTLQIVAPKTGEGLTWRLVLARPDVIR